MLKVLPGHVQSTDLKISWKCHVLFTMKSECGVDSLLKDCV